MGRTNSTYRNHLDSFISKFKPFRQGLRAQNQKYLDSLWEKAHQHAQAADRLNSPKPGLSAIVSILVGVQKEVSQNQAEIENLKQRIEELED